MYMSVWIRVRESSDTALPHAILREFCDIGKSILRSPTEERKQDRVAAARKAVKGGAARYTVVRVGEGDSFPDIARASLQDIKARAAADAKVLSAICVVMTSGFPAIHSGCHVLTRTVSVGFIELVINFQIGHLLQGKTSRAHQPLQQTITSALSALQQAIAPWTCRAPQPLEIIRYPQRCAQPPAALALHD
jgi:membrane-bound lytic murein transglycosylase B